MAKVPVQQNVEKVRGNFVTAVAGATVRIVARDASSSSPATHYDDSAGSGASTADLTADASGVVSTFLTQGSYDVYFKAQAGDSFTGPTPLEAVDTDNIPSGGGGGAVTFDEDAGFASPPSTPTSGWSDLTALTVTPAAGEYVIHFGAIIAGNPSPNEVYSIGLSTTGTNDPPESSSIVQLPIDATNSQSYLQGVVHLTLTGAETLRVVFGHEQTGDLKVAGRTWISTVEIV